MSGVVFKKRKRWPGTRSQALWLQIKRAYGGEKKAREALVGGLTAGWGDNVMAGLRLLQEPNPIEGMICESVFMGDG